MNETATTAPLSDYVVMLLLAGPAAAGNPPRDAVMRAELRVVWGVHGERVRDAWRAHEDFLRQAAGARGITPRWPGRRFFAEALAGQKGVCK